jgi:hypothetical protein
MITLKQCKRDGQRLAITLADGDREESVYLGPQSVGSAFIQQESNAQELARLVVDAVNALLVPVAPMPPITQIIEAPMAAETGPVVVPAKPTKRSGK